MAENRSFSLLSLFLMMSLAAAIAGIFAFRQQAIRAQAVAQKAMQEVQEIRAKFGHIVPQKSFNTDEKVILSYFGNDKLERGIVFWLEPHAMWEARRAKSK